MKPPPASVGSTYRFQFTRDFGFDQAIAVLEYLKELGITDLYSSPILRAGSNSTHGYDVCSPKEVDPKLGGRAELDGLIEKLKALGLGLLLDIVPNHMRTDLSNTWWRDILEDGLASRYAQYFDIDWYAKIPHLRHRVLLPVLGDPYIAVLERGELKIAFSDGVFWICYYDNRFPVAYRTCANLLDATCARLAADDPARLTVNNLLTRARELGQSQVAMQLGDLYMSCEPIHSALDQVLQELNGTPGQPGTFDKLDQILKEQNYRLCWWRIGSDQINYRRFFDITELICLNAQNPEVFDATHQVPRFLVHTGLRVGLRVDHPDGLWDPQQYFKRLKGLWDEAPARHFVVAEKILSPGERLPADWPITGTTGYEFLNQLNSIFVDERNEDLISQIYRGFTGMEADFAVVVFTSRRKILHQSFHGQFESLVRQLIEIAWTTREGRDFTVQGVREVLGAYISAFPVYRTYVAEQSQRLSHQDCQAVNSAARNCLRQAPGLDTAILEFLRRLHRLELDPAFDEDGRTETRRFLMKLQQLTAPLAAKGLEDTACYIYNRLLSLNEVGGDPRQFGASVQTFHRCNQERLRHWPDSLLASTTHDTKRSEDARARINVLSEMPEEWAQALQRWRAINAVEKTRIDDQEAPSPNDEYFAYQTLIGAWPGTSSNEQPPFRERVTQCMLKAIREAKERTSWTDGNAVYEAAVIQFIERILSPRAENRFLSDFTELEERIAFFGRLNSLSQTLLKITSPGVPDFYQGTELWDFSMVDPDNRRPVDFTQRIALFENLKEQFEKTPRAQLLEQLITDAPSGRIKLFVIWRLLNLRQQRSELFARGSYEPVTVRGSAARHLCAFSRQLGQQEIVAVAPRLIYTLQSGQERLPTGPEVWSDTSLILPQTGSGRRFTELFTGRSLETRSMEDKAGLRVAEILTEFPIALLSSEP